MVCNTCGRNSQNEDANFCEYCGSSLKGHVNAAFNTAPQMQMRPDQQMAGQMSIGQGSPEKPVSFLNWLGTYGLLFIPYVGLLVFITMLFVWSFKKDTPASKKNWARVSLIFIAVAIVVIIIYIIIIMNSSMFQQMLNGTFDYKSYYESIYNGMK